MWPEINDNLSNTFKSTEYPHLESEDLKFRRLLSNALILITPNNIHTASFHFQIKQTIPISVRVTIADPLTRQV